MESREVPWDSERCGCSRPTNSHGIFRTHFRHQSERGLTNDITQVQLPSYNWTKNQIVSNGWLPANSIWTYLASSSVSGICVLIMMQPADTVCSPNLSILPELTPFDLDVDADVQPTHDPVTKRQNARHALQKPYRLPLEDCQDGGCVWMVQR